jgi:hypothetical protein
MNSLAQRYTNKLRPEAGPKKLRTLTLRYGGRKATRKTKTGRELFDKEEFKTEYHVQRSRSIHSSRCHAQPASGSAEGLREQYYGVKIFAIAADIENAV